MNNVYRITGDEMCETCIEKDRRLHELEMHDQDQSDLKVASLAFFTKMLWLGILLAALGGGSAAFGFWALDTFSGVYAKIMGVTIWVFGAYVLLNAVIATARYHTDKTTLRNRLEEIRDWRRSEIYKLRGKVKELEKKEKKDSEHHG